MNVMIVGLGSMGKRRARLLKGILPDVCLLGVDSAPARRAEAEALGFATYETLEAGIAAKPDAAFVCTAPISHAGIIRQLLQNGIPVFTELNLIDDGYDELQALAAEKNVPLFLSSTMLWRGETRYIRDSVREFGKPVSYIYHIGQYLPDWHPWENYKNFFVGDKRTNGCREIFGIELPWLLETFGEAEIISVQKDKLTELEIDYPDSWFVALHHANGTKGFLAVDVASPKAVRNFECFGEGLHLFWEGNPKALYRFDKTTGQKEPVDVYTSFEHDSRYSDNIVENAYVDEISEFLDVLDGRCTARYSYAQDQKCIDLMNEIGV